MHRGPRGRHAPPACWGMCRTYARPHGAGPTCRVHVSGLHRDNMAGIQARIGGGAGPVHGRHAPPRSANLCAGANSLCPCRADMWGNAQVSRLPGRVCAWGNLPIPPAGAARGAMCRFHTQDQHGRIIYRATAQTSMQAGAAGHAPHRVHAGRDAGERVPSACSVHGARCSCCSLCSHMGGQSFHVLPVILYRTGGGNRGTGAGNRGEAGVPHVPGGQGRGRLGRATCMTGC